MVNLLFRRLNAFALNLAGLAEAEGRMALQVGGRVLRILTWWTLSLTLGLVATLLLTAGLMWLLADWLSWPVALLLAGGWLAAAAAAAGWMAARSAAPSPAPFPPAGDPGGFDPAFHAASGPASGHPPRTATASGSAGAPSAATGPLAATGPSAPTEPKPASPPPPPPPFHA